MKRRTLAYVLGGTAVAVGGWLLLDALIVTEDGGYRLAWDIRFRVADPTGILARD